MADSHSHSTPSVPTGPLAHSAPAAVAHDQHNHHGDHEMHLKLYWGIGGVLVFCTALTVFLSYVDFGSAKRNIVIGLLLATFKVSLVGAVFMHLKGEKATVWRFLYFTFVFVLGLFLLTALHWMDPIFGTTYSAH
jgi:cytochrome c oxidase subunit IV